LPSVPVTRSVYVPGAVDGAVEMTSVVAPPAVTDGTSVFAETPAGVPAIENATGSATPDTKRVEVSVETDSPWTTVSEGLPSESAKSPVCAATPGGLSAQSPWAIE